MTQEQEIELSCDDFLSFNQSEIPETEPYLRALGYVGLFIGVVVFPAFWFFFVYQRVTSNADRLRKRNLPMITAFTLGAIFVALLISLTHVVGNENFNCHIYATLGTFATIFTFLSLTLRVWAYFFRVRFNQKFIESRIGDLKLNGYVLPSDSSSDDETIPSKKGSILTEIGKTRVCSPFEECLMKLFCWNKPAAIPDELQFPFFLSSTRFSVIIFLFFGTIFCYIGINSVFSDLVPAELECFGCLLQSSSFFIVSIFMLLWLIFLLIALRKYPDSLGVKFEIYVFGFVNIILHVLFIEIPFEYVTVLNDAEAEGVFDSTLFIIIENLIVLYVMLPHQVFFLKRQKQQQVVGDTLEQVIDNKKLTKAYLLYLSTCLAMENLVFYKAAEAWVNDFDTLSDEHKEKRANDISKQFLEHNAFNKINISSRMSNGLIQNILSNKLTKHLFQDAAAEVFMLLQPTLKGFKESTYLEAYQNNLNDKDIAMIDEGSIEGGSVGRM